MAVGGVVMSMAEFDGEQWKFGTFVSFLPFIVLTTFIDPPPTLPHKLQVKSHQRW
jgi:hypothetical protein